LKPKDSKRNGSALSVPVSKSGRTGSWEFIDDPAIEGDAFVIEGVCTECERPLQRVYDYTGTVDTAEETWVDHVMDETARQLHDLLGTDIAHGQAGEWRDAVDAKEELETKLYTLMARGGS
jgi:hypothetical protein